MKELLEKKLNELKAEMDQLLLINDDEAIEAKVAEYRQSLKDEYAAEKEEKMHIITIKIDVLNDMIAEAAAAEEAEKAEAAAAEDEAPIEGAL